MLTYITMTLKFLGEEAKDVLRCKNYRRLHSKSQKSCLADDVLQSTVFAAAAEYFGNGMVVCTISSFQRFFSGTEDERFRKL